MMKKIISTLGAALGIALGAFALTFISAPTQLVAQSGQIGTGQIWGNPTTGQNIARPTSISSVADIAFGTTQGSVLIRGTTQWGLWLGFSGGIPYFNTTSTLTSSALLTQNAVMLGGGAGVAPTAMVSNGSFGYVLHGRSTGSPFFAPINFTTDSLAGLLTGGFIDLATNANAWQATANKPVDASVLNTSLNPVTITQTSGTITLDLNSGIDFQVTLTTTPTFASPAAVQTGRTGCMWITQPATGWFTASFGANWKFASGVAPTLTTSASATDVLCYKARTSTFVWGTLNKDIR